METREASSSRFSGAGESLREISSSEVVENPYQNKIGIYGWRKRCLYGLILLLLIIVVINLALTLWIFKVMEFSIRGMGLLNVLPNALQLNGKSFIMGRLLVNTLRSRPNQAVVVENYHNITVKTSSRAKSLTSLAGIFEIKDPNGDVVFSTDGKEIFLNTESLSSAGEHGTTFSGSVQTPSISAESGEDLKLQSNTGSLETVASEGIFAEAKGGSFQIIAREISATSTDGFIRMSGESIRMPRLPIPNRPRTSEKYEIFELCVCNDGKLFLALPESTCSAGFQSLNC